MTLLELRTLFRRISNDTETTGKGPALSDAVIDGFLNESEKECSIRGNLIQDSTTASICEIPFVLSPATNKYAFDSHIIDILDITLESDGKRLGKLGYKALNDVDYKWKTRTGEPDNYAADLDDGYIYIDKSPEEADTMLLNVYRTPLTEMSLDNDTPEINSKFHYDLVWYALHLKYLIYDSDYLDVNASSKFEAMTTQRFGPRRSAQDIQRNIRSSRRRAVAQFK